MMAQTAAENDAAIARTYALIDGFIEHVVKK
jgi:hypothetical protein